MIFSRWLKRLFGLRNRTVRRANPTPKRARHELTWLEERAVPALFAPTSAIPSGGTTPHSVVVADFNGDGKLDIAASHRSTNNVGVLIGNGGGGFAAASMFPSGGSDAFSLAAGDFNNDGKADLAVAHLGSNNVGVLIGTGAGGFAAPLLFTTGGVTGPTSIKVGDLNNDGKQDLVTANYVGNTVGVLLGNGGGGFGAPTAFPTGASSPFSVALGDVNADGKLDAVAGNQLGTFGVLLGNGSGGFGAPTTFSAGGGSTQVLAVAVADFNADGKLDLAAAHNDKGTVGIALGNGTGAFGVATAFGSGTTPRSLAVGDFNADGKVDIAVANSSTDKLTALLGNGAGAFTSAGTFPSGGDQPTLSVTGDFNGDGFQDVAVTNFNSNTVGVLLAEPPRVVSITRLDGNPSKAASVTYQVTFSEDVQNVGKADFATNAGAIASVSKVSDSVYDVTVDTLGAFDGTQTLSFAGGQDIADKAGLPLANTTPTGTNDNTYLLDHTPPTVNVSTPASPTNDNTPTITVTASDAGSGVPDGTPVAIDVDLDNDTFFTGTELDFASGTLTGGSASITLPALSPDGTYRVRARVSDVLGHEGSDKSAAFVVDTVAPTVTIDQKAGQADPTKNTPINFTVVFSEPVTTFATGDVTITGTAGATSAVVTGSGTTYNVAVSGMTSDGTVIVSIAAGKAADAAGNANAASTSTDNQVTYDTTPPAVPAFLGITPDNGEFNNDEVTDTSAITVSGTAEPNSKVELFNGAASLGTVVANGTGNWSFPVSLSQATHTLTATATDAAGNTSSKSGGFPVRIDLTDPTVTLPFANDKNGNVGKNQTVTYTVTFSEDINAGTVDPTDFENAGTATVTVVSATETTPTSGVFVVVVQTNTSGTVQLRIKNSANIQDIAGNAFAAPATDTKTITAAEGLVNEDGGGNLVFTDVTGIADALVVSFDGTNYVITNKNGQIAVDAAALPNAKGNGTGTVTIPATDFAGTVLVNTGAGNDSLTVDYSKGTFAKAIGYNGGADSDSLVLDGGGKTFATVAHTFDNTDANTATHEGTISVTGNALVSYKGLEPIADNLAAVARVFTFNVGPETVTVSDPVANNGKTTIDSDVGETVEFANPTGSLTINAGTGIDVVNVDGIDQKFGANLTINGDAGADTVNLNAVFAFAAGKNLVVNAETVTTGAAADLVTSGAGVITLTADAVAIALTSALKSDAVVTIVPQTAGQLIDLGGADVAGTLGLTDAELDRITAGVLRIGNATSGTITISAPVEPLNTSTLSLRTNGNILQAVAGPLTVESLAAVADGEVNLDNPLNAIENVAGSAAANAVTAFNLVTATDLDVTTVDGVVGIQATNATNSGISLASSTSGTELTVSQPVASAKGFVTFTFDAMSIGAGVTANDATVGGVVLQPSTAGLAIAIGGADAVGVLGISQADLSKLSTPRLTIGNAAAGNIDVVADVTVATTPNIPTLNLVTGAAVLGSNGKVLTADKLNVAALTTIGAAGDPFVVDANTLTTNGTGNQFLAEGNTVTIGDNDLNANGGVITLTEGTFVLTATGSIKSNVNVGDGAGKDAALAGVGEVNGKITVAGDGSLSPAGAATGIIGTNLGDVSFVPGSKFVVQVNGTTAGTTYDQLVVKGTVTLGNAKLVASGVIGASAGSSITLIDNDGGDAIVGTFFNLPEGALVNINGNAFSISYKGGVGNNDVVFQGVDTFVEIVGGNLVVTDVGSVSDDTITIRADFANSRYIITDPLRIIGSSVPGSTGSGTNTVFVPFAAVAGPQILVNTLDGNDQLTIDLALGNFAKVVVFDGGAQAGDNLVLAGVGKSFATVLHTLTSDATGAVDVAGNSQFQYLNVESGKDKLAVVDRTFNFTGGSETIAVTDPTAADGKSTIDSTSFGMPWEFTNPTTSLTLNAGSGDDTVTVAGIDSKFDASLTINGGAGTDAVNLNAELKLGSAASAGNLVITSEAITLSKNISTNNAANAGSVLLSGAVQLANNVTINATGAATSGDVAFNGTVNGTFALLVSTQTATGFAGAVGGTAGLASLTTDAGGTTFVNAGLVATTGDQFYGDAVVVGGDTNIQAANVTFAQTLTGGAGVFVQSPGVTAFNGAVNLGALATDAGGTTGVNGGAVTTAGAQSYGDAVTVGKNTTFAAGGDIAFANTLGGAFGVTATSPGTTTFGGAVGLAALLTNGGGVTAVNGGGVTTTGTQTYDDAVTTGADATFNSGGAITFNGALTNAGRAVAVNSPAVATFNAAVNVGALATDAGGSTAVNGGSVTTVFQQSYGDPVTLGTNTTFASTANGEIAFLSTLTGAFAALVSTGGTTIFNGAVSVAALATDGPGATAVNGGAVTTTAEQFYGDPVSLGASTVFAAGGSVTFAQSLGGNVGAVVNSPAATTFGGPVTVGALVTDAPGTTAVNGGSVITGGDQTFNDPVAVGGDATFAAGGNIVFNQTLTGNVAVGLNSGNATVLNGAVAVGSLTTNAGGTTFVNGGSVATSGTQTYLDAVVVGKDTSFTSGGDVAFDQSLTGPFAVTLLNQATDTFRGVVDVGSFATDAGGFTVFSNGLVRTTGGQTLGNNVQATVSNRHEAGGPVSFVGSIEGTAAGLTLSVVAPLTNLQQVVVGFAEVFLQSTGTGVSQTGGSIVAPLLSLTGTGEFELDQGGNDFSFLRVQNVSNGFVCVRDANDLELDLTGGFTTTNADVFVRTGRNFRAVDPRGGDAKFSSPLINLGTGGLYVQPGLAGPASVRFVTEVAAKEVFLGTPADREFCGVQGGGNDQSDTFRVRPSATTPITVYGNNPLGTTTTSDNRGDKLNVELAGLTVANFQYDGQDGFFDIVGRQKLDFFSIESLLGRALEGYVVMTGEPRDASGSAQPQFAIRILQTINGVNVGGGLEGAGFPPNAFVVSPALVTPLTPNGSPRIAFGDVNGDGLADVIIGNGPGSAPLVTVINGKALNANADGTLNRVEDLFQSGNILAQFFAYDPRFLGGVNVAAGDIDGDGRAEIVTGADIGGGPHVRTFSLVPAANQNVQLVPSELAGPLGSFFAFNAEFRGGVRVAAADVNGDGFADLVLGAGLDGGPRVTVRDGKTGGTLGDFFVYDPSFRGGIFVDAGDYNLDGFADIVTGAGVGGGPHVRVFDGRTVSEGSTPTVLADFFAFAPGEVNALFGTSANVGGVGGVAFGGLNATRDRLNVLVSTNRGPRVEVKRASFDSADQLAANADNQDLLAEAQLRAPGSNAPVDPIVVPPTGLLNFGATVDGFVEPEEGDE